MHNILNIQIANDYINESKQELALSQLDIENAYDINFNQLMSHMGLGYHIVVSLSCKCMHLNTPLF